MTRLISLGSLKRHVLGARFECVNHYVLFPVVWSVKKSSNPKIKIAEKTPGMGSLRLVGSLKVQVPFAEYCLFHRALSQKRPITLRSLLIVAPHTQITQNRNRLHSHVSVTDVAKHAPSCPKKLNTNFEHVDFAQCCANQITDDVPFGRFQWEITQER